MAILGTQTIETINKGDLEQIPSKLLRRSFGQGNDSIELNIFDQQGKLLIKDESFRDYTTYNDEGTTTSIPKITSIDIDYEQVLKDYGYNNGTYSLNFSFQRQITSTFNPFIISEISPSRREIRVTPNNLSQFDFEEAIIKLSNAILSSAYIKDINLSFGKTTILALNILLDKDKTGLIKLYNPLPFNIRTGNNFKIYEEIINPLEVTIQLKSESSTEEIGIDIGPPNFNLSTENIFTVPSGYKTFDQILTNGSATSSFNNIQSLMSGSGVYLDLEYDNTNTPSGYHFENFIHFSSATERLQNFKYKLGLLEQYSGSIANLNIITGSVSSSNFVTENRNILNSKQDKLIQSFDHYERYLYYESSPFAWPKTNTTRPFINAKTDSADVNSWFGVTTDTFGSFNGGQMYSASKFDEYNQYNLVNTIPPHIKDNSQNDKYVLFTEMIGQHFDDIWAYIDSITDINEAHSGLKDGISKDLVLNQLTSRGISAYDQFSNSSIYEYLIGDDGTGTFQFGTNDTATMVSASVGSSIPKGDIAKEIWKRLYHNSSYLLKTKGTERGLKALIACYGIPETVLHVKEYGGPLVDKTGFRTFSYQKESTMTSHKGHPTAAVNPIASLNQLGTGFIQTTKTLQLRFLPTKGSNTAYDVISLIDPNPNISLGIHDVSIGISQSIDPTKLNSGSLAHLVIASGSSTEVAGILGITGKASSNLGPIFNGEVWNLSVRLNSGSTAGNTVEAFATNTTPNKNTYVLSCSLDVPEFFRPHISGDPNLVDTNVLLGNSIISSTQFLPLIGSFTGSIQEYRGWNEKLTKATIVSQSLSPFNYNGNTISSSYESLYIRLPLGSNNQPLDVAASNYAPNKAFHIYQGFSFSTGSTFIEETHH